MNLHQEWHIDPTSGLEIPGGGYGFDGAKSILALKEDATLAVGSDLHVGCKNLHLFRKGLSDQHIAEDLASAAEKVNHLTLVGDIFELMYHRFFDQKKPNKRAREYAEAWLGELCEALPHCQIHLMLGNHDERRKWCERLVQIEAEIPNLTVHPTLLRIGSSLFLHGDQLHNGYFFSPRFPREVDAKGFAHVLSRTPGREKYFLQGAPGLESYINARVHDGVQPVADFVAPPEKWVARLLGILLLQAPGLLEAKDIKGHDGEAVTIPAVTDIFFGHTHQIMVNSTFSVDQIITRDFKALLKDREKALVKQGFSKKEVRAEHQCLLRGMELWLERVRIHNPGSPKEVGRWQPLGGTLQAGPHPQNEVTALKPPHLKEALQKKERLKELNLKATSVSEASTGMSLGR